MEPDRFCPVDSVTASALTITFWDTTIPDQLMRFGAASRSLREGFMMLMTVAARLGL
jgi:hypothetical protein